LNVVAIGDSITEGLSYDKNAVPYPDVIARRLGSRAVVHRIGKPGGTTLDTRRWTFFPPGKTMTEAV